MCHEVDEMLISEQYTILETLKKLDQVARKVLFVAEAGKLLAAVTDGDIRRWILKGGSLEAPIGKAANYNPRYVYESNRSDALECMKKKLLEAIPVVDKDSKIIEVLFLNLEGTKLPKKRINSPVVIMAGGLGTRLYPYTKILPKPLIPVGDIPIAEHIINRFCEYGCNEYYMVVNHKRNMIKAYFNEIEKGYRVHYVDEDIPLGTGGGLSLLKGKIKETFILTNCDILIEEDIAKIYEYHKKENNLITMVASLKNFTIPYGVVDISESGSIGAMREKPELSFFTNTGCYVVEQKVIEELEENRSVGFPDIINEYKEKGERIGIYPINENAWLDMGQLDELEKMKQHMDKNDIVSI